MGSRNPLAVAIGVQGSIYVLRGSPTNNQYIQKFDSTGAFLSGWGPQGDPPGYFEGPQGAAVDSQGNLYISDTGNHRVQKFDSNGTFLTKWGSYGDG